MRQFIVQQVEKLEAINKACDDREYWRVHDNQVQRGTDLWHGVMAWENVPFFAAELLKRKKELDEVDPDIPY